MDASELFSANLRLIDQVARSVCLRRRLRPADVEDFLSAARLALIENNYAILRRYEGRSSLASFLAVVFDHMISDQQTHALGRWRPSRAAERMGPQGVLLETLVQRDHWAIDDALPHVQKFDASLTRRDVESMAAQLPERIPRPRVVPLGEDVEIRAAASESSDAQALLREARSVAVRTSEVIRGAIQGFELEDRMLIRLHFGAKMSIADIARMLRLPARPLYRRLEARLRDLREALDDSGLDSRSIVELIGVATTEMSFGLETSDSLENGQVCPSPDSKAASLRERSS